MRDLVPLYDKDGILLAFVPPCGAPAPSPFVQQEWMHGYALAIFAAWIALCIGFAIGAFWAGCRRDGSTGA